MDWDCPWKICLMNVFKIFAKRGEILISEQQKVGIMLIHLWQRTFHMSSLALNSVLLPLVQFTPLPLNA